MTREDQIRQALHRLAQLFARQEISQDVFLRKRMELLAQHPNHTEEDNPRPAILDQQAPFRHLLLSSEPSTPVETQDSLVSPISPDILLDESAWTPLPSIEPGLLSVPEPLSSVPSKVQTHPSSQPESWIPLLKQGDLIRKRYRIQQLLGHGSVGYVFRVEDTKFGGFYSLKVISPHIVHQTKFFDAWVQTFYSQQTLQHSGITRTYLLDEDPIQNIIFYLREYIEGVSLQSMLQPNQATGRPCLDIPQVMHVFQALVQIIRFAHQHQMYFLDLTPHNLMMSTDPQEHPVRLLDFLLHCPLHGSWQGGSFSRLQKDLFYVPPEQLTCSITPTPATTIFTLGILLYHLLTGELPVAMAAPPSTLVSHLSTKVDHVLRKAMDARIDQRYNNLDEMVDDFYQAFANKTTVSPSPSIQSDDVFAPNKLSERWGDIKPMASPPSGSPHVHPALPSAPGSFLRGMPQSLGPQPAPFPMLPGVGPSRLDSTYPSAAPRAAQPKPATTSNSSHASHDSVHPHSLSPNAPRTKPPQSSKPPTKPTPPVESLPPRGQNPLGEKARPVQKPTNPEPTRPVQANAPTISNADRIARLRSGPSPAETVSPEPVAPMGYNVSPIQTLYKHQKGILVLATHPSRSFLASTSLDNTLQLWDTQTWHPIYQQDIADGPSSHLCWNARGDRIAYCNDQGFILLQDLHRHQPLWKHPGEAPCSGLQWHPQHNILFISFSTGVCECWNLEQKPVRQWRTQREDGIEWMTLFPCRREMVTVSSVGQLLTWSWDQPREPQKHAILSTPHETCSAVACLSQSPHILIGTREGQIVHWDAQKKTILHRRQAHLQSIRAFAIPPHERWWASGGNDQRIHLWSSVDHTPLCTFATQPGTLRALALESKGMWLASAGSEPHIQIWDTSMWNASPAK